MAGDQQSFREYLSPLKLALLATNAVAFGGLLVLLAFGRPLVILTIATGVTFGAQLAGAVIASRQLRASRDGAARI